MNPAAAFFYAAERAFEKIRLREGMPLPQPD